MKSLCRDCLGTDVGDARRCAACGSPRVVVHGELDTLNIAHLDCDAFYASVEKRDRPELRDLPVIVGGGKRGVVSTCCYIARQYGVRSAMPMFKALKACPEAVVIKPDFAKYKAASRAIFDKVRDLTPLVQTLSLDEAWIDLAGTARLNGGPPAFQLIRLQQQIERDVGLTVSIGLAANRFLAKIASDIDKPRGFTIIGRTEAVAFLAPRPVSILPGVGPVFAKTLASDGYRTIGDLAAADQKALAARYGEHGLRLHALAHARDSRRVDPESERKGMSCETTFNDDLTDLADLEDVLWPLCDRLAAQARREGVAGRVLTLKLRKADFKILTRRRTLVEPTQTARAVFAQAREMLAKEIGPPYRLIGVGLSDLIEPADVAADLFGSTEARALKAEQAIDALRDKFGKAAVTTGRGLKPA
ncbi:DNA polymerase IV [Brevundimonas aveniformis]|uniref:DNA polymerase IV n=1 Tax=Brevundimonas aveniformis TaxID=370977 RepID=UPI0024903C65|nr:DNA polymerase IV [Brevundimonas aveniformis]